MAGRAGDPGGRAGQGQPVRPDQRGAGYAQCGSCSPSTARTTRSPTPAVRAWHPTPSSFNSRPAMVTPAEQERETLRPGMIPGLFAGLRQLLMRSGTPQEPQKRLPGVHAAPQAGQFASSFVISAIDVRLTGAAAVGAGSGRARRPNGHMRQFWRRRRGWSRGVVSSAPGVRPASSRRRTAQSRSAARVVTRVSSGRVRGQRWSPPVCGLRQCRAHVHLDV